MTYLQVTCWPPSRSSHEQPDKARSTHAQPGFFAHSGNQPQAGPPFALSSQYQPFGHKPSPQGMQVPSEHAGAGASLAASLSSDASALVSSAVSSPLASACSAGLPAAVPPPQAESRTSATMPNQERLASDRVIFGERSLYAAPRPWKGDAP